MIRGFRRFRRFRRFFSCNNVLQSHILFTRHSIAAAVVLAASL